MPFPADGFDAESCAAVWREFHAQHETRFGFAIPGETIEVITMKCTAVAETEKPRLPRLEPGAEAAPVERRAVWFEQGRLETPVFERASLAPGQRIEGPALVEEAASVTVLRPGQVLDVAPEGHLVVSNAAK